MPARRNPPPPQAELKIKIIVLLGKFTDVQRAREWKFAPRMKTYTNGGWVIIVLRLFNLYLPKFAARRGKENRKGIFSCCLAEEIY